MATTAVSYVASAALKIGEVAVSVSSKSPKPCLCAGGSAALSPSPPQTSAFNPGGTTGPALWRGRGSLTTGAAGRARTAAFATVSSSASSSFHQPHFHSQRHDTRNRVFADSQGSTGGRRLHTAAALATETAEASKVEDGQWTWDYEGAKILVHLQVYGKNLGNSSQTVLMLPTLSDVSTTDEWQAVAEGLLSRSTGGFRVLVVDWPGLGLSERPPLHYTADVLEQFLADFMSSYDGLQKSDKLPVIVGCGHSATIAARALSKGLVKARALVAVAPTWAGPLPIVFGRDSKMEFRYKLLRNTLRAPGVGWAMYKFLVSSEKNIRMQYLTHVYADANNVTPSVVESRTKLTQRDGARFAPAAFLTGLLDPTRSREELLEVFLKLNGTVSTLVMSTAKAPRRSRAEMEALEGAAGVTQFVTVPGALLPQEEYPDVVTEKILAFIQA